MSKIRAFGRFWWDFVVGDDWRVAAGVLVALVATKLLTSWGVNAWWLLPAAVVVLLTASLARAAGKSAAG